jgi:hypothetical protein
LKIKYIYGDHYASYLAGKTAGRFNQSVIVNLSRVIEYNCGKKPEITMENGQKFALAHRRKAEFKKHKKVVARMTAPHGDD